MESIRSTLGDSLTVCMVTAFAASGVLLSAFVPLAKYVLKRKRSINHHLIYPEAPDDYWWVVSSNIVVVSIGFGIWFHWIARAEHIAWNLEEISYMNVLNTPMVCLLIRETLNFGMHFFYHTKIGYNYIHWKHHLIFHPFRMYDGIYASPVEFVFTIINFMFIPVRLAPKPHLMGIALYLLVFAFFGFFINHGGREYTVELWIPGIMQRQQRLVIWSAQHHHDHHVHRNGNYAEFLSILDEICGTTLHDRRRKPLPAQLLWKRVRHWVLAMGAIRELERRVAIRQKEQSQSTMPSRHRSQKALSPSGRSIRLPSSGAGIESVISIPPRKE